MTTPPFAAPRLALLGALLGALALACGSLAGCAASSTGSPKGSGGNASGGVTGSGGSSSGSGGNSSGGSGSGGSASGGSASGGSASGGSASGGSASGGSASGGSASGGSASGGSASGGSASGSGGSAGGGGAAAPACPTDAFFCTDFEGSGLPDGAKYFSSNDNDDWTKGTMLDTTVFHPGTGKQSIQILKIGSYSLREFQVPAAPTFWFRAYMRTDVAVGGAGGAMHNLFLEAMWTTGQQDKGAEIVEEDCALGMNITDTRFGSNGTKDQPGCPTADPKGTQLAANTWYCIEGFFDGPKGDFQLYVDEQKVIDRTAESKAQQTYSALRFGYRQYHERQRVVWFDDVVTAPQRIYCLK